MKISFNHTEISFLRHCLNTTGEVEVGADGKESLAPRRLKDVTEVSQRRHFTNNTKEIVEKVQNVIREKQEAIKVLTDEKKKEYDEKNPREVFPTLLEDATEYEKKEQKEQKKLEEEKFETEKNKWVADNEEVKEFVKKANEEIDVFLKEDHEIEVVDKTKKVLKKYFEEFAAEIGFSVADDEAVASIADKLK